MVAKGAQRMGALAGAIEKRGVAGATQLHTRTQALALTAKRQQPWMTIARLSGQGSIG